MGVGWIMRGVGWLSVCSVQSGVARGNVYWVLGVCWGLGLVFSEWWLSQVKLESSQCTR